MAPRPDSHGCKDGAGPAAHQPKAASGSVLLFEAQASVSGAPDILADLSAAELRRVVETGNRIDFKAGDYLFRQGEPHRGIFVLRSGVVRSFYVSPHGREITLANWGPGNFVGGPDIFETGPHVWSGVAVEAGQALHLSAPAVRQLMATVPNFSIGLIKGLAFKGKCYSSLLQVLATRSVVERLALLLLNFAEPHGTERDACVVIAASPSHEELAAMVGATRQWISMALERFRKRGLIETRNRRLVILRPAALAAIADGVENL
ncbi:MAG TPA: Crp/Fnr family transcriptional regulator [Methylovirgula sp.]|nr:Crp/Fnr family transcriptional regulator [Methylovirgula sp.]